MTVQRLVRHSKPSTTADLYLHKGMDLLTEAIGRQDERISAAKPTGILREIRGSGSASERAAV